MKGHALNANPLTVANYRHLICTVALINYYYYVHVDVFVIMVDVYR